MQTGPVDKAPTGYVFVSYSETDQALVERLVEVMKKHGLKIRWDADLHAGEDWAGGLARMLDDAAAVVVAWSDASAQSTYVVEDAARARAARKLVPVSFTGLEAIPASFRAVSTIDLSGWEGDDGDPRFQRLMAALAERVGLTLDVSAPPLVEEATPPESGPIPSESGSHAQRAQTPAPPAPSLRPAARELLGFTLAIASARGATDATNLDLVLASLARPNRTKLDKRELEKGATGALLRALPEPSAERIGAALSAAGVNPSALPNEPVADPNDPRLALVVPEAYGLVSRVGGNALWSHHLVAAALVGEPLPDVVLTALGVSQEQMRAALREGIATRWSSESSSVWDAILGVVSAHSGADDAIDLHPASITVLSWAREVRKARGGNEIDDLDVVLGALASARWGGSNDSGSALYRSLPSGGASPSQRLSAAFGAIGLPTVPDKAATMRADEAGRPPVMTRAVSIAQRTSGKATVWPRHLLAAALTGTPLPATVVSALGVDGNALRRSLLDSIERAWPGEPADAWAAVLGTAEVELTAPFATDHVFIRRRARPGDAPELADRLGVDVYVGMLATLIARKTTAMPVSIGLFGEWGSGKSYFMELIRQRVDTLAAGAAKTSESPYHDDILQVRFNAWHYADTNLGASLAAEFFDQLAQEDTDPIEDRRKKVQEELTAAHQVRVELLASTKAAETRTAELRIQWAEASAKREQQTGRFNAELLRAVADDPNICDKLTELAKHLGLEPEERVKALQIAKDLQGVDDDLTATRLVLGRRSLRLPFALLMLALVVLAVALAASDEWAHWLEGGTVAAIAALIANVGVIIGRSRQLARDLRGLADGAEAVESRVLASDKDLSELVKEMRNAEAEEAVARARVDEVLALIAQLDRQLVELNPGRRLYQFLAERAASTDYRSQLGVISLVRRDFEQLVALMEDWRLHPTPGDTYKPIDRIVLYIDDLDRCEPDQVVAVLQAVHLLLAMDLFVVVVGVDPRWLLRSLRRRYRGVLGARAVVAGDRDLGFSESTPQNYLEKIFQVPFVLPGMDGDGFTRLVEHLARPVSSRVGTESWTTASEQGPLPGGATTTHIPPPNGAGDLPAETGGTSVRPEATGEQPAEASSEVAAVVSGVQPMAATAITDGELSLLSRLAALVRTPRAATRLFNVYGLLRSTRDLTEGGRFLGGPGQPGDYQAVAQLLGILTAAPQLLGLLLWGRRSDSETESLALCRGRPASSWTSFVDGLEPSAEDGTWSNGVADSLSAEEVEAWQTLVHHLKDVREHMELDDIDRYRLWGPRIARFSFLLSPFATDQPDTTADRAR
jgi:hypothetical protein